MVALGAAVVLIVLMLGSAVAPSPASAFVGESTVIASGGGDLTSPAKSIITNPTFIPENVGEAGLASGSTDAGAAAGVFETSGLLPALGGGLLAFGAGVGIGSAICHVVGIEGCWLFESTGTQTSAEAGEVLKKGTWEFFEKSPITAGPGYAWYWHFNNSLYEVRLRGYTAPEECNNFYQPPNMGFVIKGGFTTNYCEVGGKKYSDWYYAAGASSMQNRKLSYSAGNGGFAEYKPGGKAYEAPKEWSKQLAKSIEKHSGDSQAKVGEKIASKIAGSEVADPYAQTVPSCKGLLWLPCKKEIEELKLVPERSSVSWETAELGQPAQAVIEVPKSGALLEPGTKVKVITNPDESEMPLIVPAPEPGESYDHYVKRLATQQKPNRVNVCEACIDPEAGPDGVVRVHPSGGTRQDPATEHEIEVQTNPADAPDAGGGGGSCGAGALPAIDLSPLNQPLGSRFPFGVFTFFILWLGEWETSGDPEWTLEVIPKGAFGSDGVPLHLDFGFLTGFVEPVRLAFLFVSFVGLLWFMGTAFLRLNGDDS